MVAYENESLPDDQKLDEHINREEYRMFDLYMKMVVLLVKATIITSHLTNIMFHTKARSKNGLLLLLSLLLLLLHP